MDPVGRSGACWVMASTVPTDHRQTQRFRCGRFCSERRYLLGSAHDRAPHPDPDRGDASRRTLRRLGDHRADREGRRRGQPAGARRAGPQDDPRPGRRVLLHRLPPVVRRLPVRQGALHLGQRGGAARTPPRLRAAGRRPAQRRLRRQRRRLGLRLGVLPGRRYAARGGPAPDRRRRPRPRPPASSRPRSATGWATSPTRSAPSPATPASASTSSSAATASADHARRPPRGQRRPARAAASRSRPAW